LHNGDAGAATTNILTLLALVHKDTADTILISHLVRIAMTAIAVGPTWELLQATNVNDAELAAVQNSWQQTDFVGDSEKTFLMERAAVSAEIELSRTSHKGFTATMGMTSGGSGSSGGASWSDMLADATRGPRSAVGEAMWRSSWSYSAQLRLLQADQVILDGVRTMETNQTHFYKTNLDVTLARIAALGFTNTGGAIFRALQIPDLREVFGAANYFGSTLNKTLQAAAARDVVVAATALKRFQIKYGKWPQTLDELAPEFLPAMPMDLYDGKPLKYHSNTDGTFLLYSVGDDGRDDGGDTTPAKSSSSGTPSWSWQRARDWVWPQPASPAEVQYYYEHPPK
jgi:hypothetical protein